MDFSFGVVGDSSQELFVDWLGFLCDRDLGGAPRHGGSPGEYTIGLADDTNLTVRFKGDSGQVVVEQEPNLHDLVPFVTEAFRRGQAGDYGEGSWFSISFECKPGIADLPPVQFTRSLSEHKRYEGDWALTSDCLLRFEHEEAPGGFVIYPKFSLSTEFRVPSPWHGPYGKRLATDLGTLVRAVCAFASGSAFDPMSSPPWPLSPERVAEVKQQLASGVALLHVDGLLLGPALMGMTQGPDAEAFYRARGSLFAYEQAMLQSSEFVALILLVTAMEALTVPNTEWRRERIHKRFLEMTLDLGSGALGSILKHPNFEAAFGRITSQRRFLRHVYDLRSRPLHTGMVQQGVFDLSSLASASAARVALVSELAREALIQFLRRPYSSLYGHPDIDMAITPDAANLEG